MPLNPPILTPFGSDLVKDKAWFNGTVIGPTVPELNSSEIFDLDPRLPSQGIQPHPENIDLDSVVIPRGRFVGAVPRDLTYTGRGLLTFADGLNVPPLGFTFENQLVPVNASRPVQPPRFWNNGYIEVPYLEIINDAYGILQEGDFVTAYYGSVSSTNKIAYEDIGKPVKWVEKALYQMTVAASGSVNLSNANLPGIVPTIVFALNGSTFVSGGTVAWNNTTNSWIATFGSNVTTAIYQYGQSIKHKAGQVYRIKQISINQEADGWLRWVEQNWMSTYSPLSYDYPVTTIGLDSTNTLQGASGETPASIVGQQNVFQLSHGKIAPHRVIKVHIVSGAILDLEGNLTDISNTDLALRTNTIFENFAQGEFYRIDFVRGYLYLSDAIVRSDGSPIQNSDIRVAYSYASKYEYGRTTLLGYGVGLRDQTDGRYTGLPGTPIHLERAANDRRFSAAAGKFGALRIKIH